MLAPIFLGFALHSRGRWILALDPIPRATGTVARVFALRHDALAAKQAGVLEHERPVLFKLRIQDEAGSRLADKLREQPTPFQKRLKAQILPVQLEQVESAEMDITAATAQPLKFRKAGLGTGDGF